MKNSLIICLGLLLSMAGRSQLKRIPIKTIYNQHTPRFLIKQDSIVQEYDRPIIEVNEIVVQIIKAYKDPKTGEFRLVGRTHFDNASPHLSLPSVSIFSGNRSKNVLTDFKLIGESKGNERADSSGFFDIRFHLRKREAIYFYLPNFYLEEFKLGTLTMN